MGTHVDGVELVVEGVEEGEPCPHSGAVRRVRNHSEHSTGRNRTERKWLNERPASDGTGCASRLA